MGQLLTCASLPHERRQVSADGAALQLTTHQEVGLKLGLAKKSINPAIIGVW
jgi:hypothetical protein